MEREIRHEMGNVLAVNRGLLNLLEQTELSAEQTRIAARLLQTADMLEQILTAGKKADGAATAKGAGGHGGAESCHAEAIPVLSFVRGLVESVRPMAEGKALQLAWRCTVAGSVTFDRRRAYEILLNLLLNAIKYTDAGDVTLSAARLPQEKAAAQEDGICTGRPLLVFTVRDSGPGIPPQDLQRIFEPGVRLTCTEKAQNIQGVQAVPAAKAVNAHRPAADLASGPDKRTSSGICSAPKPGSGLGLAICRKMAKEMGGRIWAESGVGQGAAFFLAIPADRAPDFSGL